MPDPRLLWSTSRPFLADLAAPSAFCSTLAKRIFSILVGARPDLRRLSLRMPQ
ncbi:MAG: hypothetical protein MZU79_03285 [Anaerotruncus sp.]|nr:hypothetical protein [Anaerotruncus sp.]